MKCMYYILNECFCIDKIEPQYPSKEDKKRYCESNKFSDCPNFQKFQK